MILGQALRQTREALLFQGIAEARLEAELLLMHILGAKRAELYTRLQEPLSSSRVPELEHLTGRRQQHEPLAYLLKRREFYGMDFYVDSRVFIPRPESELLVEQAIEFAAPRTSCVIADIGTGGGAIALTLALHLPQARVYGVDISPAALEVAAVNCQKYHLTRRVHLLQGDLLKPLPEPVDVIVANLPYISDREWRQLAPEMKLFEPKAALWGGETGLDIIGRFLAQSPGKLRSPGLVLAEMGAGQGEAVLAIARSCFPRARAELLQDLGGIERAVRIETNPEL